MRVAFSRERQAAAISYDVVAERSGVARRTIQRLENGEREGQLRTWFHLANAVDLDLAVLVQALYEKPLSPTGEDRGQVTGESGATG